MKLTHCLITGCAGFIGSSLVDRLLLEGYKVTGIDNFSTGFNEFLVDAKKSKQFTLIKTDLLNKKKLQASMAGVDIVFHMAANADVRFGLEHPKRDLEQNTIATFNVLEAMRLSKVKKIVFSSTGSVYGEAKTIPTPESTSIPMQTSLYGASKIAAESFIQAYCEGFDIQAYIFRFVSILGERYTHGHVFDFYKQLLAHPDYLNVLGNGKQKKSYLYVQDCIDAILYALANAKDRINIFNLGTDEYCEVNDSIRWISQYLKLTPNCHYAGGERGWVGDNPFIFLDCSRIKTLGWRPKLSIQEGIVCTLEYLQKQTWLLEKRK